MPADRAAAKTCGVQPPSCPYDAQQITILVDVATYAVFARQPLQVTFRHRPEPAFLPGIDRDHEVAREALHDMTRNHVGEPLFLKRGDERIQAGLRSGH